MQQAQRRGIVYRRDIPLLIPLFLYAKCQDIVGRNYLGHTICHDTAGHRIAKWNVEAGIDSVPSTDFALINREMGRHSTGFYTGSVYIIYYLPCVDSSDAATDIYRIVLQLPD